MNFIDPAPEQDSEHDSETEKAKYSAAALRILLILFLLYALGLSAMVIEDIVRHTFIY